MKSREEILTLIAELQAQHEKAAEIMQEEFGEVPSEEAVQAGQSVCKVAIELLQWVMDDEQAKDTIDIFNTTN